MLINIQKFLKFIKDHVQCSIETGYESGSGNIGVDIFINRSIRLEHSSPLSKSVAFIL